MKTQRRRRKEAKTDYKSRFNLLKSGKERFVVRKTNRYIIAQIVHSDIAQDKILASANSKDLIEKGWPKEKSGSLKSLQAAYLTGYLLAKKSNSKSGDFIFDLGLHRNMSGGRVFSALKGALDGGLKISHSESALPDMKVLSSSKSLSGIFEKVREKIGGSK